MLRSGLARSALARFILPVALMLVGVGILRGDAKLSTMPADASKLRWRLAAIGPDDCGAPCRDDKRLLGAVGEELGNFAAELTFTTSNLASLQPAGIDAFALIDPSGAIIARFPRDLEPSRMASRIRVLMTGRFDAEIAETCTPQAAAIAGESDRGLVEVRDRWQKGL